MINLYEVIEDCFHSNCKHNYSIDLTASNIVRVSFAKFSIILYYSKYEYELIVNYFHNGKESDFNEILLSLGCDKVPTFKYMSNEDVMRKYLKEYIDLINSYFTKL